MLPQPIKNIIGNEELKLIVKCLNDKPFNNDYKLVTFDELNRYSLILPFTLVSKDKPFIFYLKS